MSGSRYIREERGPVEPGVLRHEGYSRAAPEADSREPIDPGRLVFSCISPAAHSCWGLDGQPEQKQTCSRHGDILESCLALRSQTGTHSPHSAPLIVWSAASSSDSQSSAVPGNPLNVRWPACMAPESPGVTGFSAHCNSKNLLLVWSENVRCGRGVPPGWFLFQPGKSR